MDYDYLAKSRRFSFVNTNLDYILIFAFQSASMLEQSFRA